MDKVQQTPLAKRIQGAGARSMGLPVAMGLYVEDFLGLVGRGRSITRKSMQRTSSPMRERMTGSPSATWW